MSRLRRTLGCLLLLAALQAAGCWMRTAGAPGPGAATPSVAPAARLMAEGKQAFRAGQYGQAEQAFRQALASRPDLIEAQSYLGRCAYETRQYNQAALDFLAVVAGRPRSADGWLGLAQSYEALQRPQDALPCYQEALRLQPQAETARQGILRLGQVKRIAVTIDDGPSLTYSLKAMDEAEKYGGRVTFFVTGVWAARDPQIIRLMQRRGHQIGNHTYHHVDLAQCPEQKIREELGQTSDLIVQQGGDRPIFLRPPYGAHNALVDRIAGEMGMKVVLWDLDPEDWRASNPASHTVSYIASHTRPDAVILIHQVHNTYTVLGQIFSTLHQQGYTCVRLDELPRYPTKIGG